MKHLLLVALVTLGATTINAQPLIVAHRGASAYAPENTVPSIQMAWDLGADGAEWDIYTTGDKKVMLLHDKSTSRTSPGSDYEIKKTDSDTLEKLDVGAWKDKAFEGVKLPYLEQAIEVLPKGKFHVIEIKDGPETVAPVKNAIEETGRPLKDFKIISFNLDTCIEARKQMPDVEVYFLESAPKDENSDKRLPFKEDILQIAEEHNFTGVNLDYRGVTKELVDKAHDLGQKFLVWTVDNPADVKRMTKFGVDAITTNRPDTTRRAVNEVLKNGKE